MISDSNNFLIVFNFSIVVLAASVALSYRAGIFPLKMGGKMQARLHFMSVLGAFLSYVVAQIVIVPILMMYFSAKGMNWSQLKGQEEGVASVVLMLGTAFAVMLYSYLGSRDDISLVWSRGRPKSSREHLNSFFIGGVYWFICYPLVLALGQILGYLLHVVLHEPMAEQGVVQSLRGVHGYPIVLSLTLFCIVFLIPIAEELLFRGFLQTSRLFI